MKNLVNEGKNVVLEFLNSTEDGSPNLDTDNAKELLAKSKNVIKNVTQSEEAQNLAKKGKLVCMFFLCLSWSGVSLRVKYVRKVLEIDVKMRRC